MSVPVTAIDIVKDDYLLAAVYSAADLFVHPALADNLPNGVLESLACGTPVVAFDVGGVAEAVRPMEQGISRVTGMRAISLRGLPVCWTTRTFGGGWASVAEKLRRPNMTWACKRSGSRSCT